MSQQRKFPKGDHYQPHAGGHILKLTSGNNPRDRAGKLGGQPTRSDDSLDQRRKRQ